MNWGMAAAGVAVALGLAGAAALGGRALMESRAQAHVVSVKGLAERAVEADVAAWRVPFRGEGAEPAEAVAGASRARDAVRAFARNGGITEADLADEPFVLKAERRIFDNGAAESVRYIVVGAVRVRTADVAAVAALSARTLDLLAEGVALGETDFAEAPRPTYAFTRLNAIKPDLIAEATRAARDSAQRFAADSGARVGPIVSANQGVIQILPRDGDFEERHERHKTVRVVTSVDYRLVN